MPKNKNFQRSPLLLMVHQKQLVMSYFLERKPSVMSLYHILGLYAYVYNHDNEVGIIISIYM